VTQSGKSDQRSGILRYGWVLIGAWDWLLILICVGSAFYTLAVLFFGHIDSGCRPGEIRFYKANMRGNGTTYCAKEGHVPR
jgi:hypothetical protein